MNSPIQMVDKVAILVIGLTWIGSVPMAHILAEKKGLSGDSWAIWTFALPLLPLLVLCFLPARRPLAVEAGAAGPTAPLTVRRWHISQGIGGILVIALGLLIGYNWAIGGFETTPTKCADLSVSQINRVLANAPFAELAGTKVLEIISTRDTGSKDANNLQCDAEVFANTGRQMTLHITTRVINSKPYITVSMF